MGIRATAGTAFVRLLGLHSPLSPFAPSLWKEIIALVLFATDQALNHLCFKLVLTSAFVWHRLCIAGTRPLPGAECDTSSVAGLGGFPAQGAGSSGGTHAGIQFSSRPVTDRVKQLWLLGS